MMKSSLLSAAFVAAAALLAGGAVLAQPKATTPTTTMPNQAPSTKSATLAQEDQAFVRKAAEAGHMEVEASKLAQQRADSQEVKTFADMMVKDHTAANQELGSIAGSKGITPPAGPSAAQQEKLKKLGDMKGAEFDKAYAKEVGVAAHEEAVKLFKDATTSLKDADLKAFAVKTLPKLEKHLGMAKDVEKKVAG